MQILVGPEALAPPSGAVPHRRPASHSHSLRSFFFEYTLPGPFIDIQHESTWIVTVAGRLSTRNAGTRSTFHLPVYLPSEPRSFNWNPSQKTFWKTYFNVVRSLIPPLEKCRPNRYKTVNAPRATFSELRNVMYPSNDDGGLCVFAVELGRAGRPISSFLARILVPLWVLLCHFKWCKGDKSFMCIVSSVHHLWKTRQNLVHILVFFAYI